MRNSFQSSHVSEQACQGYNKFFKHKPKKGCIFKTMNVSYFNNRNIIYMSCRKNSSSMSQGGKKKKGNAERREEGGGKRGEEGGAPKAVGHFRLD